MFCFVVVCGAIEFTGIVVSTEVAVLFEEVVDGVVEEVDTVLAL